MTEINFRVQFKQLDEYANLLEEFQVGFEIVLNFEDLNQNNIKKINSYNIPHLTIHAPFFDISLGSWNSYVAQLSLDLMRKTVDFVNELNIKHLVLHHNYQPFVYAFNVDGFVDNFTVKFSELLNNINGKYKILLENVFENKPEIGFKILNKLDNINFVGLCFDIGHFNIFSEVKLNEWFKLWKDFTYEYHIHDNHGKFDEHLAVGEGNISFDNLFEIHKPDVLTIENNDKLDLIKSYNRICSILKL